MPKKLKGSFCFARTCMLRGEKEKHFWFSSLGQMLQFDAIKFRGTFVEPFWPVRVG